MEFSLSGMSIWEERRKAVVLLSGVFIIGYEYRGRNTQSGCVEFSSLGMCIGEERCKAVELSGIFIIGMCIGDEGC